ncbi:MAG TPA: cell division protein ZapE [Dokdonella sp.]|uniref:cell division protein ZapE n=3 Tax=Dokdonella sp. TaxID=2291710 RepID=UPI002BB16399|nr:cell division protein ZapE [Dokdonella sp.]HOX72316.1 cell division protein ZapE [Dokdonella sp.]HPG94484.1 cell division protein ZapE [Dokdonella sp.]HPN78977.1 cell division protein ZapE [Dokdonella sp.]
MTSAALRPGARYAQGVADGSWQADPAQQTALAAFDRIFDALQAGSARPSLWQRVRGQPREAPQGLYLWGSVGRGKTFLMDLFFESLPIEEKMRVHFHRFMQDIHAELRTLGGRSDPLVTVAERIAAKARVLCLDEFFVLDIGDAMILGNLLKALFARGVTLVTTSNTAPVDLYRNGLQRERFLPAIGLLEAHCEIAELVSPTDWRLRALKQAPVYLTPPDARAERAMLAIFRRVARGRERSDFSLSINERPVRVMRAGDGAIWFDFDAICEGPRGVADYIFLARSYHTVLISGVPEFTPQTEDAAQRFVELVDELYDHAVKLVLSAAVPIIDLYDGHRHRAVFARTESRLIEMQSEDYLGREHRG